ncbi:MAG TPA: hypothetical protein VH814_14155 [Steroidobacteraceae bacterium]|jgi:hypothetical protein
MAAATGSGMDALAGRTLAISTSETPDLMTLGLLDGEDRRVLRAVLTPLVYHGARVAYGGRIDTKSKTNFTKEIGGQLAEAYRRAEIQSGVRPMIHYLRASDARKTDQTMSKEEKLFRHCRQLGWASEIRLFDDMNLVARLLPTGEIVDVVLSGQEKIAVSNAAELGALPAIAALLAPAGTKDDLTSLRTLMARDTDARIVMSGWLKTDEGGHSGIAEEALLTLAASKPLFVIGGVGGASRDVAGALGLIDAADLIVRTESRPVYEQQLAELKTWADKYRAWATEKGLWDAVLRLANSDSPREIGELILQLLLRAGVTSLPPQPPPAAAGA